MSVARPHLPAVLAVLLLPFAGTASAATYCIVNVSGLNASMAAANAASEGSTHELRLRPGTYAVPAGLEFEPAGDKDAKTFSMTGGWNSDCSARTINAGATIVDATAAGTDGPLVFAGNNTYTIEGIRFQNYGSFLVFDPSCDFDCPDTQLIRLRYNEFRNGLAWGISTEDAGQLIVSNNLITGLPANSVGETVQISYYNNESAPVIAFNTFSNIACSTGNAAVSLLTQAAGATVHHNIFESSCSTDLSVSSVLSGQSVALRNNIYGVIGGLVPSSATGNVVSQSPGFINAAGGDFHLRETAPVSVAINAGMTSAQATSFGLSGAIPSQDLDGPAGLRLIGTRHDIGAYESAVNDASILTVTKTADSNDGVCNSDCSLREAITAANGSAGLQKIEFNIPGGCTTTPHIIQLGSLLPDLTDAVEIDGYSEPETAANTLETGSDAVLCIVLISQSGTLAQALQVPEGEPAATSATIKGLAFGAGFGSFTVAVRLRGGSNHLIQGNAFGGIGPGAIGNLGSINFGLQLRGTAQNVTVGGSEPEHRNSFGGMSGSAIVLNDASSGNHIIQNNYIGLSASGLVATSIGLNGIFASDSPSVQILDNVIAAVPNAAAISVQGASATNYTIQRNRLGQTVSGVGTLPFRNQVGIQFADGTGNHRVGSLLGNLPSNIIANSRDAGVWVSPTAGNGILVRPNSIYSNGQDGVGLGVDIGTLGPSNNDLGDGDGGPNRGQNWPVVTGSLPNADGTRQVYAELDSVPNASFRIDIYRSPGCPGGNRGGDMLNRIGTITTTTNAQGHSEFNFALSGAGAPALLVAQATHIGTGDSSEPGTCYIEPVATTTQITSDSPDPSAFGQPYTVTVLVNAVSGNPTGTVTVADGSGNQCTDNSIVGGIASCQMLSTTLGNKTLTASYAGSLTHAPSSGTASHMVIQAMTSTSIVLDAPDPGEVGQPYTVDVQVRTPVGNQAVPVGSVTLSDGNAQVCAPIVLDAQGNGSCQAVSLSPGNLTLLANYAGNANTAGSSDTEPHVVFSATTTTTIVSDAPDPSLVGQTYTVQVTVTSQPGAGAVLGAVTVSDGSGSNCQIAALANGSGSCQLSSASAGSKILTAMYTPGSAAFSASSDTEAHQVNTAQPISTTTVITADTPDPSRVGEPYVVSVMVTAADGSTPPGMVSINAGAGAASCQAVLSNGSGSCPLVAVAAGSPLLTACFVPGGGYSGSCGNANHAVSKADTQLDVSANPAPSVTGQVITAAISLTVLAPGAGVPSGSVTVNANAGESCQIVLPANSCQLQLNGIGPRVLSYSYPGDASFNGSNRTLGHSVIADGVFANGFE